MGKITNIQVQMSNSERVSVFLDGKFCLGMRKRVAEGIGLEFGQEWTEEKLKTYEKFIWKEIYDWDEEKKRIDKVKELINSYGSPINIETIGFGADSDKKILEHPKEKGAPDVVIKCNKDGNDVLHLEVTGTDHPRGTTIWLRPDKIEYAKKHPEIDYWASVILKNDIHFVKPDLDKKYDIKKKIITKFLKDEGREISIDEYYIEFELSDEEVKTEDFFKRYIKEKIKIKKS